MLRDAVRARSSRLVPRVFVGPVDPVSNLRPIVYGEPNTHAPTGTRSRAAARQSTTQSLTPVHPYSLTEFAHTPRVGTSWIKEHADRIDAWLESAQLYARLQSLWLDQFNQRFWTDNNARFERALKEYEARVPPRAERSITLAPFYREWLRVPAARLRQYHRMLWLATYRPSFAQARYAFLSCYAAFLGRLVCR